MKQIYYQKAGIFFPKNFIEIDNYGLVQLFERLSSNVVKKRSKFDSSGNTLHA